MGSSDDILRNPWANSGGEKVTEKMAEGLKIKLNLARNRIPKYLGLVGSPNGH